MQAKKNIIRNKERPVQKFRFYVQSAMALLCVWIGVEFFFFVKYLQADGNTLFVNRPPGVEGFLPISSMMSFYMFIKTGIIHHAHPAGMFIFAAILLISIVFSKSFCSWLCPIGFLSELLGDFGEFITEKLFKKKLILPKFIDVPLRGLKYLLLAFFIYAIFFLMSAKSILAFLDSPYNLTADIKMYLFFADISGFALTVLIILFVLSIFIRNFWCRYLCPYGALLGLFSFLSPNKIVRNKITCIDCGLCTKACPSLIKVDKAN
jgi:polyferredoxin